MGGYQGVGDVQNVLLSLSVLVCLCIACQSGVYREIRICIMNRLQSSHSLRVYFKRRNRRSYPPSSHTEDLIPKQRHPLRRTLIQKPISLTSQPWRIPRFSPGPRYCNQHQPTSQPTSQPQRKRKKHTAPKTHKTAINTRSPRTRQPTPARRPRGNAPRRGWSGRRRRRQARVRGGRGLLRGRGYKQCNTKHISALSADKQTGRGDR